MYTRRLRSAREKQVRDTQMFYFQGRWQEKNGISAVKVFKNINNFERLLLKISVLTSSTQN